MLVQLNNDGSFMGQPCISYDLNFHFDIFFANSHSNQMNKSLEKHA